MQKVQSSVQKGYDDMLDHLTKELDDRSMGGISVNQFKNAIRGEY